MSNTNLETIELDHLPFVTGGQGGTWENIGRQVGQAGGQAAATASPPLVRPIAQAVLPPAGREVGGWVGRQVDHFASKLPHLF